MDETYSARVDAIAATWQVWATVGASLTDAQWNAPTRCAGWNVAAVFAHCAGMPRDLAGPVPERTDDAEPVTAAEILRRFNAPDGVAHVGAQAVAEHGVAEAAATSTVELVTRFAEQGPLAIAALRAADPDLVLPWGTGGSVPLREGLRIVLMESCVHLLDVLRALELAQEVPAAALRETSVLLAEVAPPVEFIEAATGRAKDSPLPVLR